MEKKIKASELKQGDVIITEMWGSLWKRVGPHICFVMDVQECPGGNLSIMVKAREKGSLKEVIRDIFTASETKYTLA